MITRRSQILRFIKTLILVKCVTFNVAFAKPLNVLVSLTPFYNITTELMSGVNQPELIIPASASPHGYQLKPSNMAAIQEADLVVWGGDFAESFLAKPLSHCHKGQQCLDLSEVPGLTLYPYRDAKLSQPVTKAHHEHKHHEHKHHEHKHHEHKHHEHKHHEHTGDCCDHDHSGYDPHYWLSPQNAIVIATRISQSLAQLDEEHRSIYEENLKRFIQKVTDADQKIKAQLAVVKNKPYIVFHDAYQYFERHYDLNALGAITIDPEIPSSAKHIRYLSNTIQENKAVCLFSDPLYQPKIIHILSREANIKVSILDPIGQESQPYTDLLLSISQTLHDCLKD